MVLEGGIDDFEMTQRINVRGRRQKVQKLSEVSQVRRPGKLADYRIQLKNNNPLNPSLLAVARGASRVNACMGQSRYIRRKSLRSILPKEKLGSSPGHIREETRGNKNVN